MQHHAQPVLALLCSALLCTCAQRPRQASTTAQLIEDTPRPHRDRLLQQGCPLELPVRVSEAMTAASVWNNRLLDVDNSLENALPDGCQSVFFYYWINDHQPPAAALSWEAGDLCRCTGRSPVLFHRQLKAGRRGQQHVGALTARSSRGCREDPMRS